MSGIGVALAGDEMWTPRRPDWWVAGRPISAFHVVAWVAFGAAALAISVGPWRRGRPVIVTSSLVCAAGAFVPAALPYLPPVDEGVQAAGIAAALFVCVGALPVAWPAAVWWHRAAGADRPGGRGTRLLGWGLALVVVGAADILAVPFAYLPYDYPAREALLALGHRPDGLVGVLAGALVIAAGLRAAHPHDGPAGRSGGTPRTPAVESGGRA